MIALCLLLMDAPPVLSVPPSVFADARVTAPEPRLAWPAGTIVRVEARDGELVARFDRSLPDDRITAFRAAAGAAIGDLRWNDDSLVLRAAPGWTMTWQQAGPTVTLAFSPPVVVVAADAGDDAARDAALAAIEADAAAGYPGQARRAAMALAARHPDDRRVARMLADTRLADNDVRGAARGYRALAADDPPALRAIAAAPGTAAVGVVARDGDDLAQAEVAARVDAAIDDRLSAGAALRHVASRIATGRRTGDTLVDASVAVVLTDAARLQLLASAALDDAVTGGGARLVAGSAEAQVRATVLRHVPDYSTPAQVRAGGYLSRALVGATYRLTPGLVVQGDVGVNRYGLAGRDGASDTVIASAGLDYLIRRRSPTLGLSYRFEAEYVERMRRSADGAAFVPLASRENHTVQGLVGGTLGEVQLTGLAGWTIDRFGGDGPTASLGIAAPLAITWRVEGSGGITSVSRPGFSGQQLFARAQVTRTLGNAR